MAPMGIASVRIAPVRIAPVRIAPVGVIRPGAIAGKLPVRGRKAAAPPQPEKVKRRQVWETRIVRLGVGFVQPVVTGDIQLTSNAYNGLNTPWKNYLPILQADISLSARWYVSLEAMFHQPQDAHDNTRFMYPVYSSTLGYYAPYGPYSIVRLFYFKLPVTLNYRLSRHWDIGLGLEYAGYGGAIAVYNDSTNGKGIPMSQFPDVHIKPVDFRGIGKLGYRFGRFELGARFDVGLTHYIDYTYNVAPFYNVPLPTLKSRNTTLEFTLHYFFWVNRQRLKWPGSAAE
jgi:hypothetical protein